MQGVGLASVLVNNVSIPIVPNSFTYTEGLGEQKMSVQAAGDTVQQVYFDDASTRFSSIKFSIVSNKENIEIVRTWKTNRNNNNIIVSDVNSDFTRTFNNAALIQDYEVGIGAEKTIDLEFRSDSAV